MNKRMRKKRRVGEFREFGFEVRAQLRPELDQGARLAYIDRFIDAIAARRLCFGGGCGLDGKLEGFITFDGRGSAGEEDREALQAFLVSDKDVVSSELGELKDAWHG